MYQLLEGSHFKFIKDLIVIEELNFLKSQNFILLKRLREYFIEKMDLEGMGIS
jgi:hypothetical protein